MKHYVSKYAQCPYYHQQEVRKIYCEGVEEGTALQLTFDSNPHFRDYQNALCYSEHWNTCRIAGALNRKWGAE